LVKENVLRKDNKLNNDWIDFYVLWKKLFISKHKVYYVYRLSRLNY